MLRSEFWRVLNGDEPENYDLGLATKLNEQAFQNQIGNPKLIIDGRL
jgi:hypothetical protein